MGDPFWKQGLGDLLPGTQKIPFNDLHILEQELNGKQYAALFLEPIQGEAGIRVPDHSYLQEAKALCRRHGTLLVLDEVQTGFYRTGKILAAQRYAVDAGMVVLAKAMSGGLVPSAERGACAVTRKLHRVTRVNFALIEDASGNVDPIITGEGLCLAFRQATALANALKREDLSLYESAHRQLSRRPRFVADFMLLMDRSNLLQRRAMKAFTARPRLLSEILAMHVGRSNWGRFAGVAAQLGWQVTTTWNVCFSLQQLLP